MISKKEVEHIARLARLNLTNQEKEIYTKHLSQILDYMTTLNEVDTTNISPTYNIIGLKNVFKEDVSKEFKEVESILNNVPELYGRYIKVKKVIE